jgi:hypothetical protein
MSLDLTLSTAKTKRRQEREKEVNLMDPFSKIV